MRCPQLGSPPVRASGTGFEPRTRASVPFAERGGFSRHRRTHAVVALSSSPIGRVLAAVEQPGPGHETSQRPVANHRHGTLHDDVPPIGIRGVFPPVEDLLFSDLRIPPGPDRETAPIGRAAALGAFTRRGRYGNVLHSKRPASPRHPLHPLRGMSTLFEPASFSCVSRPSHLPRLRISRTPDAARHSRRRRRSSRSGWTACRPATRPRRRRPPAR